MYLMGGLEDGDIQWLCTHGSQITLQAGGTLVSEGVPIDSVYVVLDGQLEVLAGRKQVATLYAGEVIGEISLVDARPPLATVRAVQDCRLLSVPKDRLLRKLDNDRNFAANFYRAIALFLADRLRTTTTRLGYGDPAQDVDAGEELDEALMNTVSLGTRRFDELLKRLSNEGSG